MIGEREERQLLPLRDPILIERYLESRWRALVNGESTAECGSCRGCCRNAYVIGLSAEEAKTIPHTKVGKHAVLMPLPSGECPMLVDGDCSIYATRPAACRDYDCRDYAFAGMLLLTPETAPAAAEINASVLRHMENNGWRAIVPYREHCRELIGSGMHAESASQVGLIAGMRQLLPGEKFHQLQRTVLDKASGERQRATDAGVKEWHRQRNGGKS